MGELGLALPDELKLPDELLCGSDPPVAEPELEDVGCAPVAVRDEPLPVDPGAKLVAPEEESDDGLPELWAAVPLFESDPGCPPV